MGKRLLIIEDEELIRMALEDDFLHEGYRVEVASDGKNGLEKARRMDIDLIILDIMLPEINGFDICKTLRMEGIKTPIIMLTAKGQEIDRVLGLEFGADDYVTKPFSPRELQARVKAVLRRMEQVRESTTPREFEAYGVKVDLLQYEVYKNGALIELTKYEFGLLKYLIENRERVLDREELLENVWGTDVIVAPRTIDTHMANLRKKLEDHPSEPRLILSVRGVGYKIGTRP